METSNVLLDAIIAKDANELRRLVVDEGIELNQMLSPCVLPVLPLVFAANASDFSTCQLLVSLGSSLTRVKSFHLPSPLANAVSLGFNAAIETLIHLGCDVNELVDSNMIGEKYLVCSLTLLSLAVHKQNFDAVKLLLQSGANINKADNLGNSSVHYLVRRFDGPCTLERTLNYFRVQSHLNPRPDLNCPNRRGETPLMCAAVFENINAVLCLVKKHVEVNAVDHLGYTALHHAVLSDNEDIALSLLRAGCTVSNPSWTLSPLSLAVCCNIEYLFNLLLDFGADAKEIFPGGMTVLHVAADYGDLDVIDLALRSGISIDVRNDEAATPLIVANVDLTTVKFLVQRKSARIDLENVHSHTALVHCSSVFECAAYLIVEGIPRSEGDYEIATRHSTNDPRLLEFLLITESMPLRRILSLPSLVPKSDFRMKWQAIASNPHSLMHICRLAIRDVLVEHAGGKGIVLLIKSLPLPKCLQDYLCFVEELHHMGCSNVLDDNCASDDDCDDVDDDNDDDNDDDHDNDDVCENDIDDDDYDDDDYDDGDCDDDYDDDE